MSDAHWIRAMEKYSESDSRSFEGGDIIGGAQQLASSLQARTKMEPKRFLSFLEALPTTVNPAYPEAIVGGLREAQDLTPHEVSRLISAAKRWDGGDIARQLCWVVQTNPTAIADLPVLEFLMGVAISGDAQDSVKTVRDPTSRTSLSVREALGDLGDLELGGMNEERGSAYEALASGLWQVPDALGPIKLLLDRQIDVEAKNSVRCCMLRTINSVAKYDPMVAIGYIQRLAKKDLRPLQSPSGRHFLLWAVHRYGPDLQDVIDEMWAAKHLGLRTLARLLEVDRVLSGFAQAEALQARFSEDPLLRQVAAFRSSRHLTVDSPVARRVATDWLPSFFDDAQRSVRDESALVDWSEALDDLADHSAIVRAYIHSAAFEDHSDRLMRALQERVAVCPEIAFDALRRAIALHQKWVEDERHGHFSTIHQLGTFLVALYRAFEDEPDRESEVLDLFDTYLAREVGGMRSEINAFERH
jgi:hypothetical protein